MPEPRPEQVEAGPPRPDLDDEEATRAWLLATFPSEAAAWDESQVFCINNFRKFSVFFCPSMRALARRGKTMERICEEHLPDLVGRRYLNSLSSGQAITLDKILDVHRMLEAMGASDLEEVRKVTLIPRPGKPVSFRLLENGVVPSHLWVDRPLLKQFRKHFDLSCAELGKLLFDKAAYADSIIQRLEDGETKKKDGKPDRVHDYRVTPFTSDHIYKGLRAIFEGSPHLAKGDFPTLPSQSKFFIASHTAGEGFGRRTKVLGISNGNLLSPVPPKNEAMMLDRIAKFAATRAK